MALDPIYFAQSVYTDFDPRPCQRKLLSDPLENQISITSKRRQVGASETLCHYVAHAMFAKKRGWKCYIIAPNEFVGQENLDRIHNIFESTPLLRDNLKHCVKNGTEFRLTKVNRRTELLLVGDSGGHARRGITIKGGQGLLWYEELEDIQKAREVMSGLNAATAWGGGIIYIGTKRGYSGPFYDKYKYISEQVQAGVHGYAVYEFPLIEFIAERHNGKGIKVQWLKDRKAEEPRHVWLREYMGQFAEANNTFFDEQDVRNAWQTFESEAIEWDKSKRIILSIDWGMQDRTVLVYTQDNLLEDRLEVIRLETLRGKEFCEGNDIPIESFDDVIKMVCNLRDRGLDPTHVYCDKNNRGGIYSDRLANEHGFNVVDGSWNSNTAKTQSLRSLSNLLKANRFLFAHDERILSELSKYSPKEDEETGKYKFTRHHCDVISAMAMMSEYMAREDQPQVWSASLGQPMMTEQQEETYEPFLAVY